MTEHLRPCRPLLAAALLLAAGASALAQGSRTPARAGDHIVAVVNSELVTNQEVELRLARARDDARRSGARLPAEDELRRQALDALIDERVQLTHARDVGLRVDEAEIERAVSGVASQNQLTVPQLRERLKTEGTDWARFRSNLRDQLMLDRLREREVQARIRVSDTEVDELIARQLGSVATAPVLNIAQILVPVPEGAAEAVVARQRALAERALARVNGGEDFATVAREVSQDGNRDKGGEIGARPADRLPDLFVDAVAKLAPGQVAPALLRSGAGFHVLKLLERRAAGGPRVTQTRARHILLRTSAATTAEAAARKLEALRRDIASGRKAFDAAAREISEDGSAPNGGDLGWVSPGGFVPEFEQAMDRLGPGAISAPVVSRFGVHLIQVVERRDTELDPKDLRDRARAAVRESKADQAYADWAREMRNRAYVELREPPR
jgi:peptidyl-prolyl cis-trans isomerase SurA